MEAAVVRAEVRHTLPLLVLFVAGLGAGVWVFVSPWALGYPAPNGWTPSVWTSVWTGGILTGTSALSLVALVARTLHLAQRSRGDTQ